MCAVETTGEKITIRPVWAELLPTEEARGWFSSMRMKQLMQTGLWGQRGALNGFGGKKKPMNFGAKA